MAPEFGDIGQVSRRLVEVQRQFFKVGEADQRRGRQLATYAKRQVPGAAHPGGDDDVGGIVKQLKP